MLITLNPHETPHLDCTICVRGVQWFPITFVISLWKTDLILLLGGLSCLLGPHFLALSKMIPLEESSFPACALYLGFTGFSRSMGLSLRNGCEYSLFAPLMFHEIETQTLWSSNCVTWCTSPNPSSWVGVVCHLLLVYSPIYHSHFFDDTRSPHFSNGHTQDMCKMHAYIYGVDLETIKGELKKGNMGLCHLYPMVSWGG